MLTIKTKVSKSKIHGIGLFADQDIYAGTVIWQFNKSYCERYSVSNFMRACQNLSYESIIDLIHYSYIKDGVIFHILDDAKFINHSEDSNIKFVGWEEEVATHDIAKGEEILENYFLNYDPVDFFANPQLFECPSKEELLFAIRRLNVNNYVFH